MTIWQRKVEVNAEKESYLAAFELDHSAAIVDFYSLSKQKHPAVQTVRQVLPCAMHVKKAWREWQSKMILASCAQKSPVSCDMREMPCFARNLSMLDAPELGR